MTRELVFCFDFVSPTSYLAWTQIAGVQARTGCDVDWQPVFLGGIMQATGNTPPGAIKAKGRYLGEDMGRFIARYDIPFRFNPAFPFNTRPLLRAAEGYRGTKTFEDLIKFGFHHGWVEPKDLGDEAVLRAALDADGFDVEAVMAAANAQANKDAVKDNTDKAVARGAFGAPTFYVGEAMFFGQDRFDFIEAALTA